MTENKRRMDTEHPRWDEFCRRLGGSEGCNFRRDAEGEICWTCGGGMDKSKAATILADMGNIDVFASLAYFDTRGGHCDCEILFNVA